MRPVQELRDYLQEARKYIEKYLFETEEQRNEELLKKALFAVILVGNNLKRFEDAPNKDTTSG